MGGASALLGQLLDTCSALTAVDVLEHTSPCRRRQDNLASCSMSKPLTADGRDLGLAGVAPHQRPVFFPGCGNLCVIGEDTRLADARLRQHEESISMMGLKRRPAPRMTPDLRRARHPTEDEELLLRQEQLLRKLFDLHDLNHNGVLEEIELIKLNEKIAMLHHGKDVDRTAVREKYSNLFRSELDPNGDAVPYHCFRTFMLKTLRELDRDVAAQDMIMEQFVAEAASGVACFREKSFESETDMAFRSGTELNFCASPASYI